MKQKQIHKRREQTSDCRGGGCIDLHMAIQLRESIPDWLAQLWEGNDLWLPDSGATDSESGISRLYRMDKQQGPTVYNRELYSISCDKP